MFIKLKTLQKRRLNLPLMWVLRVVMVKLVCMMLKLNSKPILLALGTSPAHHVLDLTRIVNLDLTRIVILDLSWIVTLDLTWIVDLHLTRVVPLVDFMLELSHRCVYDFLPKLLLILSCHDHRVRPQLGGTSLGWSSCLIGV
jgi:hypothetical protein